MHHFLFCPIIVSKLLLNHTQVVPLPVLAGIFIMRMRCQNQKTCPRRDNSQSVFIARVPTKSGLWVKSIFLPPFSVLWLLPGMSCFLKKLCCPTHWTSFFHFPALLHVSSPSFSSLLFFHECQTPPRLCIMSTFFSWRLVVPCCIATSNGRRKPTSLDDNLIYVSLKHLLVTGIWDIDVFCLFCFSGGKFWITGIF